MGGIRPPAGTISRRGSTSAPPPPPIRRTSSISTVNKSCLQTPVDDLPPPPSPSFLQQQQEAANRRVAEMIHNFAADANRSNNVADTVRSLTELRHTPASPGLGRKSQEAAYRNATVADTVRTLTDVRHQPAWKPNTEDPIYRNSAGVAETVRTLTERKHQPASPNLGRKEFDDPKNCVAETVRTLTELRHMPASPISQRRTMRISSENLTTEEMYSRSPGAARKIYHDPRIMESYSPGTSRKIYADHTQQHHTLPQHHSQHPHQQLPHPQIPHQQQGISTFKATRKTDYEDPTKLRGSLLQAIKLSKLGKEANRHVRRLSEDYEHRREQPQEQQQTLLLQSLTARLAQMQSGNKAYRVRTLIASKTVRDPTIVHDSLMDQIRRGTVLRHTANQDQADPRM
jgi:hypothetical protein